MTLEKAIEILERIQAQDEESGRPECVEAEGLGIEALKHVRDLRLTIDGKPSYYLPGETEQ